MLDAENLKGFARFSRNPLSIIALFIVLIYGVAGYVTASNGLNVYSQYILSVFLFVFPFCVLLSFHILVSKHFFKLFGPEDIGAEEFSKIVKPYLPASVLEAAEEAPDDPAGGQSELDETFARLAGSLPEEDKTALIINSIWNSRENNRKRTVFKRLLSKDSDLDHVLATEENRNAIFDVLNALDGFATEIFAKKLDPRNMRRKARISFELYWPKAKPVIAKVREQTGRVDAYQNLERLAQSWIRNGDA